MMFIATGKLLESNNHHIVLPCAISSQDLTVDTIPMLECFSAMVDTGATMTCISKKIVDKFSLEALPTKGFTDTANGRVETTLHIVNFVIWNEDKTQWNARIKHVVQCLNGLSNDVLLGMDILKHSSFNIMPNGNYSICL
jgi:predicted aspartyl protease